MCLEDLVLQVLLLFQL
jgi:hypothetical protein